MTALASFAVRRATPVREGDEKTRAECRQEKRDVKQGGRDAARDIKKND